MAKVINNPLLKGVKGSIGKTIYVRLIGNKETICNMPDSRAGNSEKQEKQISRFKRAQHYAKVITGRPQMKEVYAKGIDSRRPSAYHVAASDYLNAPVIHYVKLDEYKGAVGDVLRIKAVDDFQVMEVEVRILDAKGTLLETGKAECYRRKAFMWLYKTTVAHPNQEGLVIQVSATDRPGNKTTKKLTLGKDREAVIEDRVELI